MPSSRPRNKWRNEKFTMQWTRSKPTRLNRTNHLSPPNQPYYQSPRNIHQQHHPHPPLLVTLLPPPREKWSLRPRVMYRSSRPRPRQATGSMQPYPQLNLLSRVNKHRRRLLIIWCLGSDLMMAAQYSRMGLMVRYEQLLVCDGGSLGPHTTPISIVWHP